MGRQRWCLAVLPLYHYRCPYQLPNSFVVSKCASMSQFRLSLSICMREGVKRGGDAVV